MKYYEGQLNQLKKGKFPMSIKLFDSEGDSTKNLNINNESIPILIKWLNKQLK